MKSIAIVPQKLFLLDKSIKILLLETPKNIDLRRIKMAAKIAQISEFIKNYLVVMKLWLERGIKLWGSNTKGLQLLEQFTKYKSFNFR